jgi:hypothetical protein
MPTLPFRLRTLEALGVTRADIERRILSSEATRGIEPFLSARGFDVTRTIHVLKLTTPDEFILAQ